MKWWNIWHDVNCEVSSFKLENVKEMLNEQASSVYDLNKVGFRWLRRIDIWPLIC